MATPYSKYELSADLLQHAGFSIERLPGEVVLAGLGVKLQILDELGRPLPDLLAVLVPVNARHPHSLAALLAKHSNGGAIFEGVF